MSERVRRLSDRRLGELQRLFADLQRLCPELSSVVDAAVILAALQAEDYRALHDFGVFIQNDVFEDVTAVDDSLLGDTPVFLPGVMTLTFADWIERFPVANDPLFVVS
jgi:hypothetical protein